MTRSQVALRCQVSAATIRYYEERELLPAPRRTASNYRIYHEDTVRRVRFVKRAQELGFTLNEIRELLALRTDPEARCSDVLERTDAKIRSVDDKLQALRSIREGLTLLRHSCSGAGPIGDCPMLDALDSSEH